MEMGGVSRYFSYSIGVRGRCDSPETQEHIALERLAAYMLPKCVIFPSFIVKMPRRMDT